ncbi:MAG TPA: hypothetical protein VMR14_16450 [Streptosporangiaceae bacterium]|nr:hypothetical protein [Streptosporangiaceae bacterium]
MTATSLPVAVATNSQRLSGDQVIESSVPVFHGKPLPGSPIGTPRFLTTPVRRLMRCTVVIPPLVSATAAVLPSGAMTPVGGQVK